MAYSHYVGVDIAAYSAQVTVLNGNSFSIGQCTDGYTLLIDHLHELCAEHHQILVVMEATGVYWMQLAQALYEAGFAVSVINPAQAHYFAKAMLARSKSDPIDACYLAQLAAHLQPACWQPDSQTCEALQQCLAQRDALQTTLQQIRNRLHALKRRFHTLPSIVQRYEKQIALLSTQLDDVNSEVQALIAADPAWKFSHDLLRSIPGVGPVASHCLLVATRNFSSCSSAQQLASYAGLVPRDFMSGSSIHRSAAIGFASHARLRQALYMATLSAVQHNPIIRAFYQRLVARGKLRKVALCACARKLIHIAWAVVIKQRPFDPDFA